MNYQIKIVCERFGNSPGVAEKHYLMLKKTEFNRAVGIGCSENPPKTVQAKGGKAETQKKPIEENPVNNWICLQSALAVLPLSYPARTLPGAENTGQTSDDDRVTPDSTPLADKLLRLWESASEDLRYELRSVAGVFID